MNRKNAKDSTLNAAFSGYDILLDNSDDDAEITHIDRGTPCGEYLRRFWQPVMLSSELSDLPKKTTLLGEELVLFRDKSGDLGLFHKHCAHRGASLEYGIIADHGLICCYHGWHYAVDGTLIRAGSEPEKVLCIAKSFKEPILLMNLKE